MKRRRWMALAAVAVTAVAWQAPAAPAAAAVPASGVLTMSGALPGLPGGSARVLVEAEIKAGKNLLDVPVAVASVSSPAFRITVPDSATLRQAEAQNSGTVNFNVVVDSGTYGTSQYVPVDMTTIGSAGALVAGAGAGRAVAVPAFPAYGRVPAAWAQRITAAAATSVVPDIVCTWIPFGDLLSRTTNIGQVHVVDLAGVTDNFKYQVEDDATVTIGVSANPASGYTASGSGTIHDSLSATGHKSFGRGALNFVATLMYYQRYINNHADTCPSTQYKMQADHSAGNVQTGTGTPAGNPFGGCRNAPHGSFPLQSGSGWALDRGRSATVSGGVTIFGLSISASAGFTSHITQSYEAAAGAATSYICGTTVLPNVPIIYNTK